MAKAPTDTGVYIKVKVFRNKSYFHYGYHLETNKKITAL